jgi:hypothetical protein
VMRSCSGSWNGEGWRSLVPADATRTVGGLLNTQSAVEMVML